MNIEEDEYYYKGRELDASKVLSDNDRIRLLVKIEEARKTELTSEKGCWIYPEVEINDESPVFGTSFKPFRAARIVYALLVGTIPAGALVRHIVCANKKCINPAHMALGDNYDNMADKVKDGTALGINKGETNGTSILKNSEARAIIKRLKLGETPASILAQVTLYNSQIKLHNIRSIKKGEAWRWMSDEEGLIIPPKQIKTARRSIDPKTQEFTAADKQDFLTLSSIADGCKIYSGNLDGDGYGHYRWSGGISRAHHVAFRIAHNRWPKKNHVLAHTCHRRSCVEPKHLLELTQSEHIKYDAKAGRFNDAHRGQKHNVILIDSQIKIAKELYRDIKNITDREVTKRLDNVVGEAAVSNIRKGKTGAHVTVDGFVPWKKENAFRPQGEKSGRSKTTASDIFKFRTRAISGESIVELAKAEGYSRNQMSNFIYGEDSWTHLDSDPSLYQDYVAPLERTKIIAEKTPVTEELKLEVIKYYAEGLTAKKIADKLNLIPKRVNYIVTGLQKEGRLQKRLKRTEITRDLSYKLRDCFNNGLGCTYTSQVTGLSISTVEKKFSEFRDRRSVL